MFWSICDLPPVIHVPYVSNSLAKPGFGLYEKPFTYIIVKALWIQLHTYLVCVVFQNKQKINITWSVYMLCPPALKTE